MVKRCRDPDSDGFRTVFVSTSLNTQIAMTLLYSDSVADFQEKIILQHGQCYPKTGALTIHSLKVKYQGKMYLLHEPDMFVISAFEGYEGRWSLYVDASSSLEGANEQRPLDPCDPCDKGKSERSRLPLAIVWKSPGECSQNGLEVGRVDGTLQENLSFIVNQQKSVENDRRSKDNSKDQIEKLTPRNSYEARSGGSLNAKKKQKVNHTLHVAGESTLNAIRTPPQTTTSSRSNSEAAGFDDTIVVASPKVSTDVQLEGIDAGASPHDTLFSGTKTSEQVEPEIHVFEKEAVDGHHSEDLSIRSLVSDMENKSFEKPVAEVRENMTSPDVPSQQVQEEQPVISTSTKKKGKKKVQETNSFVPCDHAATSKSGTVLEGSVLKEHSMINDENLLASTRYLQNIYNEEDGQVENVKPSDLIETTPARREIVVCLGMLDKSPEADNSEVSKSKIRKSRKSDVCKQDQLDVEHDLSAPSKVFVAVESATPGAHVEDQSRRDEDVLPQNDPKISEEDSDLAKNNVLEICSGGSYEHLDSGETNLNEKESALDIALVRDDLEGGKSGCRPKKKKTKKSASNYIVPSDDHKGAASTDKVEGESTVVEGTEKANEQTIVPESKRRPSKASGNQKNSRGINTAEHSSSKAKQSKSASEMETSTSSRKRSKSSNSTRDANVKALKKFVDPAILKDSDSTATVPRQLEENDGSLISSNLNSVSRDSNKSNQKKQTAGEISRKKVKDLDKSSQEKSLLTTPGTIFGDGLSESSGDENGKMKPGPFTQSPSDSSSSSSSEDLMRQGSINKEHKGGKTPSGSKLADPRNMSMDMILRSSSRYKKAKLSASQSEADSQQVDFVPESQPIL